GAGRRRRLGHPACPFRRQGTGDVQRDHRFGELGQRRGLGLRGEPLMKRLMFSWVPLASILLACSSAPIPPETALLPDPRPLVLPYAEVEAEAGSTNGAVSAFTTALYDAGAEASGRRYVKLGPGQLLVLEVPVDADSLVVRFSLPSARPAAL